MQTIVDKIKQKLSQCDYRTGYLTVHKCHELNHGVELSNLGLKVIFDDLLNENKFYIT